jgi:hypothetical protein
VYQLCYRVIPLSTSCRSHSLLISARGQDMLTHCARADPSKMSQHGDQEQRSRSRGQPTAARDATQSRLCERPPLTTPQPAAYRTMGCPSRVRTGAARSWKQPAGGRARPPTAHYAGYSLTRYHGCDGRPPSMCALLALSSPFVERTEQGTVYRETDRGCPLVEAARRWPCPSPHGPPTRGTLSRGTTAATGGPPPCVLPSPFVEL